MRHKALRIHASWADHISELEELGCSKQGNLSKPSIPNYKNRKPKSRCWKDQHRQLKQWAVHESGYVRFSQHKRTENSDTLIRRLSREILSA